MRNGGIGRRWERWQNRTYFILWRLISKRGIYKINGRDISKSGKKLHLDFSDGQWSLVITEDTIYSSDLVTKE